MAMGTGKRRERQQELWVASSDIVQTPANAFYDRLNEILNKRHFDRRVEHLCRRYYRGVGARPSITPGVYFRSLLIGYFEGLDSERGIAWRVADSLSLRKFLSYALDEQTPDHSTISRTRRLFWLTTHRAVFRWVLKMLVEEGLLAGQTVSVDATTLEANAALRSIVRRDTGERYEEYLKGLAEAAGIENPTREQLARFDRKRKKKVSNRDWKHPYDPDARITKMKDGRTHLAHKAEHAVDLSSGAVLKQLHGQGVRSYIPEPERGRRNGQGKQTEQQQVYANRRRVRGETSKRRQKLRCELTERSFAHLYETGGMRRVHLKGRENILKRLLIHAAGCNLALVMRKMFGVGKPRRLQGVGARIFELCTKIWRSRRRLRALQEAKAVPSFTPSRFSGALTTSARMGLVPAGG